MGLGMQKCFLFLINFPTFLIGGGILGIGIYMLVGDPIKTLLSTYVPPSDAHIVDLFTSFKGFAIIIYFGIAFGALLFVSGFLGCCGAITENKCMLILYSTIVSIILLILIAASAVIGGMSNKIFDTAKNFLRTEILSRYTGNITTSVYTMIFDSVQLLFHCCGVNNATDYVGLSSWNNNILLGGSSVILPYPPTCCKFNSSIGNLNSVPLNVTTNCLVNQTFSPQFSNSHIGCFTAILHMIKPYMNIVIGVVAGLGSLLIVVDVCSCYIIKNK